MSPHHPAWKPPFCPNPNCQFHQGLHLCWPYKKIGFYTRQAAPKRIQRFLCHVCHRSFSRQTFCTSYWLKRPDLLSHIFLAAVACSANRQIARSLQVSPPPVDRLVARLGRHSLLFHMKLWQQSPPTCPLVIDGFESFEKSQYYPFEHQLAVEAGTGFFSFFTDSELRRKGRMTAQQKQRRAELEQMYGRPPPGAVRRDVTELLQITLAKAETAVVYSDKHRAYPLAIRQLKCRIRHEVTPGREHRDSRNSLYEVNLLDGWIRHSSSNHKRQTIAPSKRRQASSEKLAVLLVHRNYMRSRREKARDGPTPAMLKGLTDRQLSIDEVLEERLFPSRISLPRRWQLYYRREIRTRALAVNRRHTLKYAC
jgi:transposase-like protein